MHDAPLFYLSICKCSTTQRSLRLSTIGRSGSQGVPLSFLSAFAESMLLHVSTLNVSVVEIR